MPSHYSRLNNMQLAAPNTAPNPGRSPEWMEQIARQKAMENSSLSEREIANRERDRFLMENSPNATAQDLNEFGLDSQGRMTPNTFGQRPSWQALENLQPYGGGAPNPGRSPQWLEDTAKQKMIEDQSMQQLEQSMMEMMKQQRRQTHPLSKFREMLFPE